MKKLVLPFFMLCVSLSCFAQVKFNVQVGVNLTEMTQNEDYEPKISYRLGVGLEVPINKMWSFQSALLLLNRSFSFDKNASQVTPFFDGYDRVYYLTDSKVNALYLQLPLQVAVRIPLYKQCSLKLSAGPYLAYGIGGKSWLRNAAVRGNSIYYENSDNQKVPVNNLRREEKSTFSVDGFDRFDLGLALGVNFEYRRFFAGVGFEYGLTPIREHMPKLILDYLRGNDCTMVSPHYRSFNACVGFSF